jgi:hypothetical protein
MLTFIQSFSGVRGSTSVAEEALPPSIDEAVVLIQQRLARKPNHEGHYTPDIHRRVRQYIRDHSVDPEIEAKLAVMSQSELIDLAISLPEETIDESE